MRRQIIFAVDLDDTLIYTSDLNNDAYNFALESCGYPRIASKTRITRRDIRKICTKDTSKITRLKQAYFTQAWMRYRLKLNSDLLEILNKNGRDNCVLWTAAEKERT